MKAMKKLFALLLALTMVFGLAATGFAAEEGTYTITVKNADDSNVSIIGNTYTAYKIFDVTYQDNKDGEKVYSYTINEDFANYTYTVGDVTYKGDRDDTTNNTNSLVAYIGTLNDDADALHDFAADALAWATEHGVSGISKEADAETVVIDVSAKEAGYYLVAGTATAPSEDGKGQTVTAVCNLTTTDPKTEVRAKVEAPTLEKKIDNGDAENDKGTAVDVGSKVDFTLTSKVPDMNGFDSYQFIVHDELSDGLDFFDSTDEDQVVDVVITIGSTTLTSDHFTVAQDGRKVTITFTDFLTNWKTHTDETITIKYSAVVNSTALTTNVENNKANLEYSNDPYDETSKVPTPDTEVYVYDFDFIIDKIAHDNTPADNTDNERLNDAKFVLYKEVNGAKVYYKWDAENGKVVWVENIADDAVKSAAEAGTITERVTGEGTNEKGQVKFDGLDQGTYWLLETAAPEGYNELDNPIKVVITATFGTDGKLTSTNYNVGGVDQGASNVVVVENTTGNKLPETGGVGTTLFYVFGSIMMIGAVVLLITKKRMSV